MKSFTLKALLAGFSTASLVHADVSVSSEPLGYTTTTLYGSYANGSKKNNIVSPNLVNQASWRGTIASKSGDVLTLTGAALTADAFNAFSLTPKKRYTYYVSTNDGYWAHVVSNTATTITLPASYGTDFDSGESITIRRHLTITDYLGKNEIGLLSSPTGNVAAADRVQLTDELNGGSIVIFPVSSGPSANPTWYTTAFEVADAYPIYPDQVLQISRATATNLSLKLIGEVDTKPRQVMVQTGANFRPIPVPVGQTLGTLGLYTGNAATGVVGSPTGNIANADSIIVTTNGESKIYFYVNASSGAGWYDTSFNFVSNVLLPGGSGVVIKRGNPTNSSPFVWTIPAPVVN